MFYTIYLCIHKTPYFQFVIYFYRCFNIFLIFILRQIYRVITYLCDHWHRPLSKSYNR
nr:MAG TPA: hypothetical protein [Bacteriophage sp.]